MPAVADPFLRSQVDTLYREHHGWLQGWLRKKLGSTFDAADLAQDTFVRVLVAPAGAMPAPLQEPRAYLTLIAKRLLANLYRRRSLELAYAEALAMLPEPVAPSPEQQALVLEALQQIDAMLDSLPSRVRAAFLMAQLEGLAYAEIARRLSVSERSVKRYVAQGLAGCILLAE